MTAPRFIHLRVHSAYSLLEGAIPVKKLPGLCEAAGMPVGRYVRLVKLHQAGEHLLHGGRSAAQVSETLGFADESGFRRSFKAVTGLTPLDYVNRYRR